MCNYLTDRLSSYKRHNNSKRHMITVESSNSDLRPSKNNVKNIESVIKLCQINTRQEKIKSIIG